MADVALVVVRLPGLPWAGTLAAAGAGATILDCIADAALTETARMVVGPDEPPEGRTHEEEAALHWAYLADVAQEQGVSIEAGELAALPHDVEVSPAIRARLTR